MTRIETFTDAAFAFALTLLVVSFEPPTTYEAMLDVLREIPAFVLSATLLMVFWWGHNQWSRRFGLEDAPTILLSCALVLTVLVYVHPLRFMFGLFVDWIGMLGASPGEAAQDVTPLELNRIFAIYGAGFVVMCLTLVLLNLHAWRRREALSLDALERFDTLAEAGAWGLLAGSGLLSVGLALALPPSYLGVPGWSYLTLPVVMPAYGIWTERWLRAVAERALPAGVEPAKGR